MSSVDGLSEEDEISSRNIPAVRSGHVSVALGNKVLVWGGYSNAEANGQFSEKYLPANEIWVYDTEIDRWICKETQGEGPPGLSGAGAALIGHRLFMACGHAEQGNQNSVYILDTRTWTWRCAVVLRMKDRPSTRDKLSAWEYDNRLYIFGGYGVSTRLFMNDNGQYFQDPTTELHFRPLGWNNQLLIFDPEEIRWTNPECTGCVPSPRASHSVARMDRKLFLFGGRHNELRLNDLYSMDLPTLEWTRITVNGPLPQPRSWHIMRRAGPHHLLMHGGYSQRPPEITTGEPLDDTWMLDVVEERWAPVERSGAPACIWHTGVSTSDYSVVVFGGCNNNILDTNELNSHTNNVFVFRLSPKSLLRLSMDACFQYRYLLASHWKELPKRLCDALVNRSTRMHEAYCNSRTTLAVLQDLFIPSVAKVLTAA